MPDQPAGAAPLDVPAEAQAEVLEAAAEREVPSGGAGGLPPAAVERVTARVYGLLRRDLLLQRERQGGPRLWR